MPATFAHEPADSQAQSDREGAPSEPPAWVVRTNVRPIAQTEPSETESAPPLIQIEPGEHEWDYDPETYVAHDDPNLRQPLTTGAPTSPQKTGGDRA